MPVGPGVGISRPPEPGTDGAGAARREGGADGTVLGVPVIVGIRVACLVVLVAPPLDPHAVRIPVAMTAIDATR
jgi:hypothetical protein